MPSSQLCAGARPRASRGTRTRSRGRSLGAEPRRVSKWRVSKWSRAESLQMGPRRGYPGWAGPLLARLPATAHSGSARNTQPHAPPGRCVDARSFPGDGQLAAARARRAPPEPRSRRTPSMPEPLSAVSRASGGAAEGLVATIALGALLLLRAVHHRSARRVLAILMVKAAASVDAATASAPIHPDPARCTACKPVRMDVCHQLSSWPDPTRTCTARMSAAWPDPAASTGCSAAERPCPLRYSVPLRHSHTFPAAATATAPRRVCGFQQYTLQET